jgi:Family of unknown function (DUF6807)
VVAVRSAAGLLLLLSACATHKGLAISNDEAEGSVAVMLGNRELLRYQYAERWALPHLYPVRSPSGKSLTVQRTEPFSHHRSIWIADKISLTPQGKPVDFYHEWKNQVDKEKRELGHMSRIQHVRFLLNKVGEDEVILEAELLWMVTPEQAALREIRRFTVRPLGDGEFLLDLVWTLHADFGDVKFHSDWVHYAWPYIRMSSAFSGDKGGVIEDNQGRRGQEATNGQYARWVDYSGTVDGVTEGLAAFLPADQPRSKWLTREYGCFGPRRPDILSGQPFTLKKGTTMQSRVGIFVHSGGAESGKVADRYEAWSQQE